MWLRTVMNHQYRHGTPFFEAGSARCSAPLPTIVQRRLERVERHDDHAERDACAAADHRGHARRHKVPEQRRGARIRAHLANKAPAPSRASVRSRGGDVLLSTQNRNQNTQYLAIFKLQVKRK